MILYWFAIAGFTQNMTIEARMLEKCTFQRLNTIEVEIQKESLVRERKKGVSQRALDKSPSPCPIPRRTGTKGQPSAQINTCLVTQTHL